MAISDTRAEELYDLLADNDLTCDAVCDVTGWSKAQFHAAVQRLRDMLADGDDISVIAEPNGFRQPWLFGLRSNSDLTNSRWIGNRISDSTRRLMTLNSVITPAVRSTNGRSIEGRKARTIARHVQRAIEDIAELAEEGVA